VEVCVLQRGGHKVWHNDEEEVLASPATTALNASVLDSSSAWVENYFPRTCSELMQVGYGLCHGLSGLEHVNDSASVPGSRAIEILTRVIC
jgi:hypothetical protein